ncbi:hypothetical protein EKH57_12715 [Halorubrum sp. BOL3-1]|uniref:hypothetical protein n=1 Tax=Halorubrum sp. BOL3-1 TaxID=2497325 RepID=UPI0010051340|nr:hypothetical protein [Halorubrum sp. BOL3-1]QAU13504.1 hypothetical protein EKH57_12715 [Halorubrum sp. BOL3-1]
MEVPSEASFGRRYRALSTAERREFVSELWAACGWETTREAGESGATSVVARRDGRVRRVAVGTPVPDDADVIVGDGTRRVLSPTPRRRAEAVDATYVSPTDLRERLLYGTDRDAADRLFRRHFGVGIADAAASPKPDGLGRRTVWAGRRAARAGRSAVEGVRSPAGALALVTVLLAAAVVVAGGGVPAFAGVLTDSDDAERVAPSPPADGEYEDAASAIGTAESAERGAATLDDAAYLGLYEEGLTGTVGSTARTPPGVFLTGVYDPDALADAHVATAESLSSASVLLVASGPANATRPDGTTGGRIGVAGDGGVELAVASATRYRLVRSGNASVANATGDGTVETFADGDAVYERTVGPDGVETRRVSPAAAPNATALVGEVTEEPVRRFLNGSDSTVRAAATAVPLYRVEVEGGSAALGDEVRDVRAVAFVTADGLVLELSATYVHVPTGERVRVAFQYDRLGDTDAIPPRWYWELGSTGDGTG